MTDVRISIDAPLPERIEAAMQMVRPLVDQGEDYIWRPAAAAMDVLSACKKALADRAFAGAEIERLTRERDNALAAITGRNRVTTR